MNSLSTSFPFLDQFREYLLILQSLGVNFPNQKIAFLMGGTIFERSARPCSFQVFSLFGQKQLHQKGMQTYSDKKTCTQAKQTCLDRQNKHRDRKMPNKKKKTGDHPTRAPRSIREVLPDIWLRGLDATKATFIGGFLVTLSKFKEPPLGNARRNYSVARKSSSKLPQLGSLVRSAPHFCGKHHA